VYKNRFVFQTVSYHNVECGIFEVSFSTITLVNYKRHGYNYVKYNHFSLSDPSTILKIKVFCKYVYIWSELHRGLRGDDNNNKSIWVNIAYMWDVYVCVCVYSFTTWKCVVVAADDDYDVISILILLQVALRNGIG